MKHPFAAHEAGSSSPAGVAPGAVRRNGPSSSSYGVPASSSTSSSRFRAFHARPYVLMNVVAVRASAYASLKRPKSSYALLRSNRHCAFCGHVATSLKQYASSWLSFLSPPPLAFLSPPPPPPPFFFFPPRRRLFFLPPPLFPVSFSSSSSSSSSASSDSSRCDRALFSASSLSLHFAFSPLSSASSRAISAYEGTRASLARLDDAARGRARAQPTFISSSEPIASLPPPPLAVGLWQTTL